MRRAPVVTGVVVVLLVAGLTLLVTRGPAPAVPATALGSGAPPSGSSGSGPGASLPTGPAPLPILPRVSTTSLAIPAIGVSTSPLQPLALLADGTLAAPTEWQSAGFYAGGPVPGERGPAVVAGHVDSVSGPAIFHRLRDLRPGDRIDVGRSDGRTVTFEVDRLVSVPKDAFPTDLVYGPTPDAQLRLITCGGAFDAARRSYVDNTVVMATAVA